jgi:hypothetical protein
MRRWSAIPVVALALLGGCGSSARPEGVVERWLLSLNRGSAGAPERYGGDPAVQAADTVLPDRRTRDPGSLDRVEVGAAVVTETAGSLEASVPFRIETTDGDVVTGTVRVGDCGVGVAGKDWCILDARFGGAGPPPGSTWAAGSDASDWGRAVVAAVVLSGVAVTLVAAVRRRSVRAGTA